MTADQVRRVEALKRLARLLDSAFGLPGTPARIGLDPVLGLLPWLGDLVSPLFTISVLLLARELGVPKVVQLRMVFNAAIDALIGIVPVVGDLFDFAWKANERNVVLLDRHAHEAHGAGAGDWVFVAVAIALVVAVAVFPVAVIVWLIVRLV